MKVFCYLFCVAFILLSCEDGVGLNEDLENDFFPLNVGNYWIYQFNKLDGNGEVIDGSQYIDSVYIEDVKSETDGIKTFTFVFYRDGTPYDTMKIRKHKNQIFFYANPDTNIIGLDFQWLPKINLNMEFDESWNIFSRKINDYEEKVNDKTYTGTYLITNNGRLVSEDSIFFNDELRFSKYFTNKFDSRLQFLMFEKRYVDENTYIVDTIVYNKSHYYLEDFRLVEGVGLSKFPEKQVH